MTLRKDIISIMNVYINGFWDTGGEDETQVKMLVMACNVFRFLITTLVLFSY